MISTGHTLFSRAMHSTIPYSYRDPALRFRMLFQEPNIEYVRLELQGLCAAKDAFALTQQLPVGQRLRLFIDISNAAYASSVSILSAQVSQYVAQGDGSQSLDDENCAGERGSGAEFAAEFTDTRGRFHTVSQLVCEDATSDGATWRVEGGSMLFVHPVERSCSENRPDCLSTEASDGRCNVLLDESRMINMRLFAVMVPDVVNDSPSFAAAQLREYIKQGGVAADWQQRNGSLVMEVAVLTVDVDDLLRKQREEAAESLSLSAGCSDLFHYASHLPRNSLLRELACDEQLDEASCAVMGLAERKRAFRVAVLCKRCVLSEVAVQDEPADFSMSIFGSARPGTESDRDDAASRVEAASLSSVPVLLGLLRSPEISIRRTPWTTAFCSDLRKIGCPLPAEIQATQDNEWDALRNQAHAFIEQALNRTEQWVKQAKTVQTSSAFNSNCAYWTREMRNFLVESGFSSQLLQQPCSHQKHIPVPLRLSARMFVDDHLKRYTSNDVVSEEAAALRLIASDQLAEHEFSLSLLHTDPSPLRGAHPLPSIVAEALRLLEFQPVASRAATSQPIPPVSLTPSLHTEATEFLRSRTSLCPMESLEDTMRRRCVELASSHFMKTAVESWSMEVRSFMRIVDFLPSIMLQPANLMKIHHIGRELREQASVFLNIRAEGRNPKVVMAEGILQSPAMLSYGRPLHENQVQSLEIIGFPFRGQEADALSSMTFGQRDSVLRTDIRRFLQLYISCHQQSPGGRLFALREAIQSPFLTAADTYWPNELRTMCVRLGVCPEVLSLPIWQAVCVPRYVREFARLQLLRLVIEDFGPLFREFPDALVLSDPVEMFSHLFLDESSAAQEWSAVDKATYQRDITREDTTGMGCPKLKRDMALEDAVASREKAASQKAAIRQVKPVPQPSLSMDQKETFTAHLVLSAMGTRAPQCRLLPSAAGPKPNSAAETVDLNTLLSVSSLGKHEFQHFSVRPVVSVALVHATDPSSLLIAKTCVGSMLVNGTWAELQLQSLSSRTGGIASLTWTPALLGSTEHVSSSCDLSTSLHVGLFQRQEETSTKSPSVVSKPIPPANAESAIFNGNFGAFRSAEPPAQNPLQNIFQPNPSVSQRPQESSGSHFPAATSSYTSPYEGTGLRSVRPSSLTVNPLSPVSRTRPAASAFAPARSMPMSVRERLEMRTLGTSRTSTLPQSSTTTNRMAVNPFSFNHATASNSLSPPPAFSSQQPNSTSLRDADWQSRQDARRRGETNWMSASSTSSTAHQPSDPFGVNLQHVSGRTSNLSHPATKRLTFDDLPVGAAASRGGLSFTIDAVPQPTQRLNSKPPFAPRVNFDDVPVVSRVTAASASTNPFVARSAAASQPEEIDKGDDIFANRRRPRDSALCTVVSPMTVRRSTRRIEQGNGFEIYANRLDNDPLDMVGEPLNFGDGARVTSRFAPSNPFSTARTHSSYEEPASTTATRARNPFEQDMRKTAGQSSEGILGRPPATQSSSSSSSAVNRSSRIKMSSAERLQAAAERRQALRNGTTAPSQETLTEQVAAPPAAQGPFSNRPPLASTTSSLSIFSPPPSQKRQNPLDDVPILVSRRPPLSSQISEPTKPTVDFAANVTNFTSRRPVAPTLIPRGQDNAIRDAEEQKRAQEVVRAAQLEEDAAEKAGAELQRRQRQDQVLNERLRKNFGSGPPLAFAPDGSVLDTIRTGSRITTRPSTAVVGPTEILIGKQSLTTRFVASSALNAAADSLRAWDNTPSAEDACISNILSCPLGGSIVTFAPPRRTFPYECSPTCLIAVPFSLLNSSSADGHTNAPSLFVLILVHNPVDWLRFLCGQALLPLHDLAQKAQGGISLWSSWAFRWKLWRVLMAASWRHYRDAGRMHRNASYHGMLCDPEVTHARERTLLLRFSHFYAVRKNAMERVTRSREEAKILSAYGGSAKTTMPSIFTTPLETLSHDDYPLLCVTPSSMLSTALDLASGLDSNTANPFIRQWSAGRLRSMLRVQREWLNARNPIYTIRSHQRKPPQHSMNASDDVLQSIIGVFVGEGDALECLPSWRTAQTWMSRFINSVVNTRSTLLVVWIIGVEYPIWCALLTSLYFVWKCLLVTVIHGFTLPSQRVVSSQSPTLQFLRTLRKDEEGAFLHTQRCTNILLRRRAASEAVAMMIQRMIRAASGASPLLLILAALAVVLTATIVGALALLATGMAPLSFFSLPNSSSLTDRDRYLGLSFHLPEESGGAMVDMEVPMEADAHAHSHVASTFLELRLYMVVAFMLPKRLNPVKWFLAKLWLCFLRDPALQPQTSL